MVVHVEHEDVHGAHFGQLVLFAVQPEDLLQSLGGGLLLDVDGGCVVGAHFAVAHASRPRPHVAGIGQEGNGAGGSSLEVASHRAEDCVEQGGVRGGNSQGGL